MKRPCLGCGTLTSETRCAACQRAHDRPRLQRRNRDPKRRALYDKEWRKHSAQRRNEEPCCQSCGLPFSGGRGVRSATVDHPTDWVLCRRCHGELEAQRRRRAPGGTDDL